MLEAEDIVYMKALEADDATAINSVTKKNSLRDAPAAAAIDNATDISSLKAAWMLICLNNPYMANLKQNVDIPIGVAGISAPVWLEPLNQWRHSPLLSVLSF